MPPISFVGSYGTKSTTSQPTTYLKRRFMTTSSNGMARCPTMSAQSTHSTTSSAPRLALFPKKTISEVRYTKTLTSYNITTMATSKRPSRKNNAPGSYSKNSRHIVLSTPTSLSSAESSVSGNPILPYTKTKTRLVLTRTTALGLRSSRVRWGLLPSGSGTTCATCTCYVSMHPCWPSAKTYPSSPTPSPLKPQPRQAKIPWHAPTA